MTQSMKVVSDEESNIFDSAFAIHGSHFPPKIQIICIIDTLYLNADRKINRNYVYLDISESYFTTI